VTFRQSQVREILRKGYVESRLHMDYPDRIAPAKFAVQRRLQQELIGSTAVPYYAVLDPDDGEFLVRHRLYGAEPSAWLQDFQRLFAMLEASKPSNH
jgi:hypothetical protein